VKGAPRPARIPEAAPSPDPSAPHSRQPGRTESVDANPQRAPAGRGVAGVGGPRRAPIEQIAAGVCGQRTALVGQGVAGVCGPWHAPIEQIAAGVCGQRTAPVGRGVAGVCGPWHAPIEQIAAEGLRGHSVRLASAQRGRRTTAKAVARPHFVPRSPQRRHCPRVELGAMTSRSSSAIGQGRPQACGRSPPTP
jgi:hypothetical protein